MRKRRNIGAMRHRVVIKSVERTADGGGGYERQDNQMATVWADVRPVSAKELMAYGHLSERVTHKVVIRWRDDVQQGQSLVYDGRDLYIMTVTDETSRKEYLTLMCREGGQS